MIDYRALTSADAETLMVMLAHAAHEPSVAEAMAQPELRKYVSQWGRRGDIGYLALAQRLPVGAAWVRLWSEAEKGYAFVDYETPELAIAVLPEYQNQGIGTQLLQILLEASIGVFPRISLSVRSDNPAQRLYQSLGFKPLPGSSVPNRVGGHSFTLVCKIPGPQSSNVIAD